MIYEENAIYYSDEFAPMQNYTRTEVCGSFAYQPENISKTYTVELWGTRQYGLASDAVFEDVLHLLTIMPSSQYDYWTFYDPRANEWMSFMNMVNNDTSYSTPVYIMPTLSQNPDYPLGDVIVEHEIIGGISQEHPSNEIKSRFHMTFSLAGE